MSNAFNKCVRLWSFEKDNLVLRSYDIGKKERENETKQGGSIRNCKSLFKWSISPNDYER